MTDTPASSETSASGWRRALPVIVSLAILAMALHALSSQFTDHGYRQIRHAFRALGAGQITLTLLLGLSSYVSLVGFDWVG
ncbi:hypothetical protein GFB77_20645, partial [Acinetobacter baumannii]|uniref:hypothetical protein n=1 Tax=Acinetobacter baumannii TaxID=470 RepID=UPI001EF04A98